MNGNIALSLRNTSLCAIMLAILIQPQVLASDDRSNDIEPRYLCESNIREYENDPLYRTCVRIEEIQIHWSCMARCVSLFSEELVRMPYTPRLFRGENPICVLWADEDCQDGE